MISDVLHDAVAAIADYRRKGARKNEELEIVVAFMDALRFSHYLEMPGPDAFCDPRRRQMVETIREGAALAEKLRALQSTFVDDATRERAAIRFRRREGCAESEDTTKH
jgi:hypothetical protein